jgi:hypothetical protein
VARFGGRPPVFTAASSRLPPFWLRLAAVVSCRNRPTRRAGATKSFSMVAPIS